MSVTKDSDLEKWIRKKAMTTKNFAELVGCSRTVIWKVKHDLPICPLYANRIIEITGGEVNPKIETVGGRR
jgi:hypothetical protein